MSAIARLLAAAVAAVSLAQPVHAEPGEVWKTATCACCDRWIEHMTQNGFELEKSDLTPGALTRLKNQSGIPAKAASCHTAKIGGYVIEGHVPASDVKRLLAERPDATGLAVAGMPIGSPGMESGETREPFDVLLIKNDGSTQVFSSHAAD